ncbi:NADP-dependent oxidoreductase domain-containing protein [Cunninghamella echinulata]|nr:NADP-dependent oxidoreductase domain-containing protein [Cunninghamella echinulata]
MSETNQQEQQLPPMQYVRFGNTGLKVSRICLGCMSYGSSKWFNWVLDEEESLNMIGKAYDAGINFFDTANLYSNGESERVLGKAIKKFNMPRGRIVVATKFALAVHPNIDSFAPQPHGDSNFVNQFGGSRKHIFDAVDASLKRLDLDYIDLYQIHRMDPQTPWEETMGALNDLVKSGKVRYIGASSMPAWEFQKANNIAEKNGWVKFVSMQNLYNLIYREEEREMIPYCLDQGIAGITWSPLSGGYLTGKNRKTARSEMWTYMMKSIIPVREDRDNEVILDKVIEIAENRKATAAQVALAWLFTKKYTTSPILGINKEAHLYDLLQALELKLTEEEIKSLDDLYVPRSVMPMTS